MRTTRRKNWKSITALALAFATAAIFTATASAIGSAYVVDGDSAPNAAEIPYLSWGATADNLGLPFQSTRNGGPVFMNGKPDGYQPAAEQAGVAVAAKPDGYQPQLQGNQPLVIRDSPDGYQPQSKTVEVATVSASGDGFDRSDLWLGFGLGLILATAGAIALTMVRDHTKAAAHS